MKVSEPILRALAKAYVAFAHRGRSEQKSWSFIDSGVPRHWPWDWWQTDLHHRRTMSFESFGPIYACVSIISQDLARIPLKHVRIVDGVKKEEVLNKAPARLFRKPNKYQTLSDLLLFMGRSLLTDGNSYSLPVFNNRFEVEELYPINPRMIQAYIDPVERDVYYRISQDPTSELSGDFEREFYPARMILHIRGQTNRHPLIGDSPMIAGLYPAMAGSEINKHTAHFFRNMTRPSGILTHPDPLEEPAIKRIKSRWKEIASGAHMGEVAVLTEGVTWQQAQMSAVDAELAKSYALSERQIFQIYRVPMYMGGDLTDSPLTHVESMVRFYVQTCLAFYVRHFELALTNFFNLPPNEKIEFDLEAALLTADIKERLEALGKGVQNGIYAPDEARAREGLPPAEGGHGRQPRVQQQLVPLSWGINNPPSGTPGTVPAPDSDEPLDDDDLDQELGLGEFSLESEDRIRLQVREFLKQELVE